MLDNLASHIEVVLDPDFLKKTKFKAVCDVKVESLGLLALTLLVSSPFPSHTYKFSKVKYLPH